MQNNKRGSMIVDKRVVKCNRKIHIEKPPRLERPHTVVGFQEMFAHIYSDKNKQYTDLELVARLVEEIAIAMELARKDRISQFQIQLPNIFSWLTAVANRLDVDIHEALWRKYPGVCSYCLRDSGCMCGLEHPVVLENKEEILRRLRRDREGREPKTLREHQELHARLYKWQNARILPIQVVAHLAEEAGEVSRAYRHGMREEMEEEMADVVSWMFAIATRFELQSFDELVWKKYSFECCACHNDRCVCEGII